MGRAHPARAAAVAADPLAHRRFERPWTAAAAFRPYVGYGRVSRPRIDSTATLTQSRTSPTVAPTTTTASGAKNAICSSEYLVTHVPISQIATTTTAIGRTQTAVHGTEGTLASVTGDVDYVSGEDYVVEFLGYRFGFNARDFEERVTAAGGQARV